MIRETGSSQHPSGDSSITLSGTKEEMDAIRSAVNGANWLRVNDAGMAETVARHHKLPDPIDDPKIPPTWAIKPVPPLGQCTKADLDRARDDNASTPRPPMNVGPELNASEGWHSPAIYIHHVGVGTREPNGYQRNAKRLTDYGFECMRSRRGADGRYWELWFLPYLIHAKGTLREKIDTLEKANQMEGWTKTVREVVDHLCNNINFGSLEVAIQRAALSYD